MRDDTQQNQNTRSAYNAFGCDNAQITVCDQSDVNTSYHTEAFETPWMKAMNKGTRPLDAGFGNCDVVSDAELMKRNIFRNNNKISNYERMLQRRHYERDIDETLRNGDSRTYNQHGFDMSSITRRLDLINDRNFALNEKKIDLNSDNYWAY
jgi:hypothetical protein